MILWATSLLLAFFIGYKFNKLQIEIEKIKVLLKNYPQRKPIETKSAILDPEDIEQKAAWEHKEMMEKLNPEQRDDL